MISTSLAWPSSCWKARTMLVLFDLWLIVFAYFSRTIWQCIVIAILIKTVQTAWVSFWQASKLTVYFLKATELNFTFSHTYLSCTCEKNFWLPCEQVYLSHHGIVFIFAVIGICFKSFILGCRFTFTDSAFNILSNYIVSNSF